MEPYWMFFETVVHTVISLIGAAAVLFTSAAAPAPGWGRPPSFAPAAPALLHAARDAYPSCPGSVLAGWSIEIPAAAAPQQSSDDSRRIAEALAGALGDADADVRRHAAIALGRIGHPGSTDALGAALGDKDKEVRRAAAVALGQAGDARAIEPLTRALKDPDADVRRHAAIALGALADGNHAGARRGSPRPNPNAHPHPRSKPSGV